MVRGLAEGNALGVIYFNSDALEWLGETSASLRRKAIRMSSRMLPYSQEASDDLLPAGLFVGPASAFGHRCKGRFRNHSAQVLGQELFVWLGVTYRLPST